MEGEDKSKKIAKEKRSTIFPQGAKMALGMLN